MSVISVIILIVALIAAWQGFYMIGVEQYELVKIYKFPTPKGVLDSFLDLCNHGEILKAIGSSLYKGLIGFMIAIAIGLVIGLLINNFKFLNKTLKPIILGIQTLPSVCWVPFAILWFGLETKAVVFVIVMGTSFCIAIAVDNAIRNIQPIYKRAALTMGASKKQMYFNVIIPAALPELISGLKQGWSFAWRSLMAGEVMTSNLSGLGVTLAFARDFGSDVNEMMCIMIVIVLLGILIDKCIFSTFEKRILRKRGLA